MAAEADAAATDALDIRTDAVETATEGVTETDVAETVEAAPLLDATPGLGVELVAVALPAAASAAVAVVVRVEANGLSFELGDGPSFYRIPAPGDASEATRVAAAPFLLSPGETRPLRPRRLVAWAPGATTLAVRLVVESGDGAAESYEVSFGQGAQSEVRIGGEGAAPALVLSARTGAKGLADARVGLTVDGQMAPEDVAERVSGPVAVKHYAGTRRWLLTPGCDSDAACAEGGVNYPCVSSCACRCDAASCNCDFSALEAVMEAEALAAGRRILGADASEATLARARVHWVFKRSLGGANHCDDVGELDASPETWGAFFAAATRAAVAINERHGFRLIDMLSPMNEANHPLQDGDHVNAAAQPTLGGFLSFVDLVRQASCSGGECCAPDRYIVARPDVPALLQRAMTAAEEVLVAAASPLAPELVLSLYLDTEQKDPLQTDASGAAPSIVTPVEPFLRSVVKGLDDAEIAAFPARLVAVDTYPGSWGAPWWESDDGIVHHMDPETARIVRVDPVSAADAAIARALAAADAVAAVMGRRPEVVLGEVGWSTFDGDEAAQAQFVKRLFDAAAAARADDPTFGGMLWFKTKDKEAFAYPTWIDAANPLNGQRVACDVPLVGPILCAAEVLSAMEGQWGLARADGTRKPAWDTLFSRW